MTLESKLAGTGQLTTLMLLLSPFPAFVFCYKSSIEKNKQIAAISPNYLVASFFCNAVWLAYALKIANPDLIVINCLGTVITAFFMVMFLYVKVKVGHHRMLLLKILIGSPFLVASCTDYLDSSKTGLMATSLSVLSYAVTLDSIS